MSRGSSRTDSITSMIMVKDIQASSLAEELGIKPGFELISVNGRELIDFLDWEFLTGDDQFVLEVRDPSGGRIEYDIERPHGLPLGVELEPPYVIRCNNKCDFCFVKGNPKGLRRALYVKDDDYRLSFRYGNFVTLTNLEDHDVERIIEYGLSPLYVSVHATDTGVRRRLLRNDNAPDIMQQLGHFLSNGISCHTQIVVQPGVNDGEVLEKSLEDLFSLGEKLLSVSVVPVGLTTPNSGHLVREPSRSECVEAIRTVDRLAAAAKAKRGISWVYGSDELYMRARIDLPSADRYDDFQQLENGVGVVRHFQETAKGFRADLAGKRIGVATGVAMGSLFPDILSVLRESTGARFELIVLENELFGPSVTTAGLLPGSAFLGALGNREDLDLALLPAEAVNDDEVFLDDISFIEVAEASPADVRLSNHIVDSLGGI